MDIRTRPRQARSRGKTDKTYDVTRYLSTGGPSHRYMKDGQQVKEQLPKNVHLPAINRAGFIVNIALQTNPMNRNYGDAQALGTKVSHEDNGFIWAHECPVAAHALHPDDEAALFGTDAKPCVDHDIGFMPGAKYQPTQLCPHLVKIQDVRRQAHEGNMARFTSISAKETQQATLRALQAIAAQSQTPAETTRSRKTKNDG